jgi:hypothetical protein
MYAFTHKSTLALALIALAFLSGCGHWPPVVKSKHDVERLRVTEPSVRARGLRDSDIPSVGRLHDLRILDFGGGVLATEMHLTDEGLAQLSSLNLPRLETLTFGCSAKITDAGLAHISQMHSVTYLSFIACPRITDAGLPQLAMMTNLTGLDLRGCSRITGQGLQRLATKTNWQTIELGGCSNVTAEAVARLQVALPSAKVKKDEKEWNYHSAEQAWLERNE